MIVAQVSALRHVGCWASDTSLDFPTITYHLFLKYYDKDHYEVIVRFIGSEPNDSERIPDILGKISQHSLWWKTVEVEERSDDEQHLTDYLIKIKDMGNIEGLIRPILYEREARFPMYQMMEVANGKEIVYATFDSMKALKRVEKELQMRIGEDQIEITTIKEDVMSNEVIGLIPTWFDYFIEQPYADLIKETIKLAEEGKKITKDKKDQIKDYLVDHPQIMTFFLNIIDTINKYCKYIYEYTHQPPL